MMRLRCSNLLYGITKAQRFRQEIAGFRQVPAALAVAGSGYHANKLRRLVQMKDEIGERTGRLTHVPRKARGTCADPAGTLKRARNRLKLLRNSRVAAQPVSGFPSILSA
jgi:hypothetical protein